MGALSRSCPARSGLQARLYQPETEPGRAFSRCRFNTARGTRLRWNSKLQTPRAAPTQTTLPEHRSAPAPQPSRTSAIPAEHSRCASRQGAHQPQAEVALFYFFFQWQSLKSEMNKSEGAPAWPLMYSRCTCSNRRLPNRIRGARK